MRSERVLKCLPHGVIRDYLVSYYVSATPKQLAINAFCTGESAMIFLNRESAKEALLKSICQPLSYKRRGSQI